MRKCMIAVAAILALTASANAEVVCGLTQAAIDAAAGQARVKWCAEWSGNILPGKWEDGRFHACQGGIPSGRFGTTFPGNACDRADGTFAPEGAWGPLHKELTTTGSK